MVSHVACIVGKSANVLNLRYRQSYFCTALRAPAGAVVNEFHEALNVQHVAAVELEHLRAGETVQANGARHFKSSLK